MKSNRKLVTAKNMMFMIPKAKLALSIAHVLFVFNEKGLLLLTPLELTVNERPDPLLPKVVQFSWEMKRSS